MPSEDEKDTTQVSISAWKEREDAEDALERYLSDAPSMLSITHCLFTAFLPSARQIPSHSYMALKEAGRVA